MLIIRADQMTTLAGYMREAFEKKTLERLRLHYSRSIGRKTDEELLDLIREGIAKAESYGIESRRDVVRYLGYMIILGNDFDSDTRNDRIIRVLKIRNLNGTEKMNRIERKMPLDQLI